MRALENADRIRETLARLPTASRADLTAEWLRLYGCAPPSKLRRELLMAAIAYRFVSEKTDSRSALPDQRKPIGGRINSSEDFRAPLAGLQPASPERAARHLGGHLQGGSPPPNLRSLVD